MIRAPVVTITIDRWDWSSGKIRDTTDLTPYSLAFQFQKSIGTPSVGSEITLWPQIGDLGHALDFISTMDVVRIYEFGTLKYQGYVTRVGYTGFIDQQGRPQRAVGVSLNSMGGIIVDTDLGLNIGLLMGDASNQALGAFYNASKQLSIKLQQDMLNGLTYAEIVQDIIDSWFSIVDSIGATSFSAWVTRYFDFKTGLQSGLSAGTPKGYQLYTGTEQSISLWDIMSQVIESPMNEMWFDEGPRDVNIDGSNTSLPSDKGAGKTTLVFRSTPFDGTVNSANPNGGYAFTNLPSKQVSLDYLFRFDLAKAMNQSSSVFNPIASGSDLSIQTRQLLGQVAVSQSNLSKYLLRIFTVQLYYTRVLDDNATQVDSNAPKVKQSVQDVAQTLKNWFQNNDRYLSGVLSMMVPKDSGADPRIGEKVDVESIDGNFYVEGIVHKWQYQAALMSYLTVTRGWNYRQNGPMQMVDRIFKRSVTQW